MERFARAVIRWRFVVFAVVLAITAASACFIFDLQADDDVMQFLPQNDPDVVLFRRVNARFGGLDVAIVGLEAPDLFTAEKLHAVRNLTREIEAIDGVFDVLSFTEVPDPRPSPFGLVVEPLVDVVPEDAQGLEELKQRVLANENAVGNLVAENGDAAMILCFLGGARPPLHVAADIKDKARAFFDPADLYFAGAPFVRLYVAGGTKRDILKLTPLVAAVILLVTYILLRRPLGVLLALSVVGIALLWLMTTFAVRGEGVTVVGSSLPTLLLSIGGAYGLHVIAAYYRGKAPDVTGRIVEALREVGPAVTASTVTTAAGFLSFLVMDVEPMREFGFHAALGVGLAGLLSLTFIPAVLSFAKRPPRPVQEAATGRFFGRLGDFSSRHPKSVMVVALVIALAGGVGVIRIAPDATLKTFFAEGSEPDRANAFLARNFGGSTYLQVYFEGDMRSPFVLAQLRKIVETARGMPDVKQVSSIIDPLVMMSEAMGGRADLPSNKEKTRSLYPFLEGSPAIEQVISPQKDAALVQIRIADTSPERVVEITEEIERFIEENIPKKLVVKEIDALSAEEAEVARSAIARDVVDRAKRLVRMGTGLLIEPQRRQSMLAVLEEAMTDPRMEPGEDLANAVRGVLVEHLASDAAPFEAPGEDATEAERSEWQSRVDALAPLATESVLKGVSRDGVSSLLSSRLPLTSARDPEGADLTAEALTAGLESARTSVSAMRLAPRLLAAAEVDSPSDELKSDVAWALTDMRARTYAFEATGTTGTDVRAWVTGQPVINVAFGKSTISNQVRSLLVALVILLIILSITFRSFVTAIKGVVPTLMMLFVSIGVMGAAHIPIDVSTSMIAAIALGIGVDYAIHFMWRRRKKGESLAQTAANSGPAIASNALQVAAGFSVMALSNMVPMRRFGLLVALTMVLSAVATFVILPALRVEGRLARARLEREEASELGTAHSLRNVE